MKLSCVRIGFGKISKIHEEHLKNHNVCTIGIVEVDPDRLREIEKFGILPLQSIESATALKPDFYDICTPTHTRLGILKKLCSIDPHANILIEKPFCDFNDIENIQKITKNHLGKISINENYASSMLTPRLLDVLKQRNITPTKVIVESTKNRDADFKKGRFIDHKLGALGYEGSHLLAIIGELGSGYELNELIDLDIDTGYFVSDDEIPPKCVNKSSQLNLGSHGLNQGGAFIRYISKNGCMVDLYTSMTGNIGYPCPPYALPNEKILSDDLHTRYRILRIDGVNQLGIEYQIVGFYEPIKNLQRSRARLAVFKNWILDHVSEEFEDNTMSQHLQKIVAYFKGEQGNPYDVNRAIGDVTKLHEWAFSGWEKNSDSEEYLGEKEVAISRLNDAKRFKTTNLMSKT